MTVTEDQDNCFLCYEEGLILRYEGQYNIRMIRSGNVFSETKVCHVNVKCETFFPLVCRLTVEFATVLISQGTYWHFEFHILTRTCQHNCHLTVSIVVIINLVMFDVTMRCKCGAVSHNIYIDHNNRWIRKLISSETFSTAKDDS